MVAQPGTQRKGIMLKQKIAFFNELKDIDLARHSRNQISFMKAGRLLRK
ncbi:MAG: hypothetical protein BROFUL_03400, partial [Candidatus Brocadia fulgida]